MEKAMAPHSSTLAWKIPWTEEPGRLQSMGSQRVKHDWTISVSLFTFMHWRGNGNPLLCSCLERDRGAWWATVYRVAQSGTWLKWLSSSSRASCLMGEVWVGLFLHPPPSLKWGDVETSSTNMVSEIAIWREKEKWDTRIQRKARIRGPTPLQGEGAKTESKPALLYFQPWMKEYAGS